jgi:hypothetical protein
VTLETIMLWMALCIGNVQTYDRKLYADAILRATPDMQERRLLVVTAWLLSEQMVLAKLQ